MDLNSLSGLAQFILKKVEEKERKNQSIENRNGVNLPSVNVSREIM